MSLKTKVKSFLASLAVKTHYYAHYVRAVAAFMVSYVVQAGDASLATWDRKRFLVALACGLVGAIRAGDRLPGLPALSVVQDVPVQQSAAPVVAVDPPKV